MYLKAGLQVRCAFHAHVWERSAVDTSFAEGAVLTRLLGMRHSAHYDATADVSHAAIRAVMPMSGRERQPLRRWTTRSWRESRPSVPLIPKHPRQ